MYETETQIRPKTSNISTKDTWPGYLLYGGLLCSYHKWKDPLVGGGFR
jgi:hypothetical protein